jgi:thiamine biosynthesis lipoprotein
VLFRSLWSFHLDWYAHDRARPAPSEADLAAARATVGFDRVRVSSRAIELPTGTRLTLNGIAQGHITDRASALLRRAGFDRVLVDLGEIRALGPRRDDAPWRIALADGGSLALTDGAVATSAGAALRFADNGDHHIFDPVTGRPARIWDQLTVTHPSAMVADAFSTGLYCLPVTEALRIARATPDLGLHGRTIAGETIVANRRIG